MTSSLYVGDGESQYAGGGIKGDEPLEYVKVSI